MKVTGVIQAGGKSTRMGGQPKALLELGGRRIIDRVVEVVRAVTDDTLIVTNTPELYASLGLPMVPDVFPDHGSLGGIYSGLKAAAGEAAFTVACDMPFLVPAVARLVTSRAGEADVVVPRVAGQLETLHACYGKRCLGPIETRLMAGQLKIIGFFDEVRVLEIPEAEVARYRAPELVFMNVNTPEELARARGLLAALERR
ncbi:MAG TPA: molybdenum cofactor guanylyltransferase [Methylomirabilota bacterium]|nr:molybdenum cofactor guanylyltransferase [Methylomirabilota bacterium]